MSLTLARSDTAAPEGPVPLSAILCTERLAQRPKRDPDYKTENRALTELVKALAESPSTILQKVADTILEVFGPGSAGLSLLTPDGKSFYWPAIAGGWQPHVGGGTPRDFGPCGDVLDRNAPLLFSHWELRYPYLMEATPLAQEGLLVPFYVRGKAVGTIWAIAHDDRRQFDAEDLRQLESLGRFASAAYQAVELQRIETSHRASQAKVAEQARSLAAVRESEKRIQALLDALPAAIYTTDAEGRITFFNRAAEDLAGRKPQIGKDSWCVTHRLYRTDGTHLPHEECPMAIAIKERRAIRGAEAFAERPDGTRLPFLPFPTPLYDETGEFVGAVNMLVDITERKEAEARERILIRELQHRCSNMLAVVQSIASRSMSGANSLVEARSTFEKRLQALARIHRRLTGTDWAGVGLVDILRDELEAFAARVTLRGPAAELEAQDAQSFSLAIHELATNAVKYGALSISSGEIAASWQLDGNGSAQLAKFCWRERGGPPVNSPSRHGFGTSLLKTIFGGADVEYAQDGFSCSFQVPLRALRGGGRYAGGGNSNDRFFSSRPEVKRGTFGRKE